CDRSETRPHFGATARKAGVEITALTRQVNMRRVVVTGIGIVSPLGVGTEYVWRKLVNGESGISSIQSFDVSDLPAKIAGQVPRGDIKSGSFNPDEYVSPKDQKK